MTTKAKTAARAVAGIRIYLPLTTSFIRKSVLKFRDFFRVLAITLSNIITRPGRMVKIQTRLMNTPFASTTPKSGPILKLMNTSTSSPTTVVTELLVIAPKALSRAFFMASSGRESSVFSWLYRLISIME